MFSYAQLSRSLNVLYVVIRKRKVMDKCMWIDFGFKLGLII